MPISDSGATPLSPEEAAYWLTTLRFKRFAVDVWGNDADDQFSLILWARDVSDIARWGEGHLHVNPPLELVTAPVGEGDRILYEP